ncbi:LacI family DNA-binding transcriptional regulator [Pseudolysinimonas kribbensis]
MSPHPVTSVDVARATGLSQATVSRALNGGVVSAAARERVLAASRDLGYRPNDVARGLVTRRTGTVGVVVSDILNPFYPEFLEALGAALGARGGRMLLQNAASGGAEGEATAIESLLRQRVDGIIVTAATDDSSAVRELVASGFPVVLAHRTLPIAVDTVESDNAGGAALMAELLHRRGHRTVGVLEGDPGTSTARQRGEGFAARARELGLTVQTTPAGFAASTARVAADAMLSRGERPTAIVGHNDTIALAALNAARELGLRVPRDVAVAGFDDIAAAGWAIVGLTTVRQPTARMAQRAVDLLAGRIEDPSLPPRREVLPVELIERTSTGGAA